MAFRDRFGRWLDERLHERTSLDGAILMATGLAILVLGPFAEVMAWIALVYGFWSIVKEED